MKTLLLLVMLVGATPAFGQELADLSELVDALLEGEQQAPLLRGLSSQAPLVLPGPQGAGPTTIIPGSRGSYWVSTPEGTAYVWSSPGGSFMYLYPGGRTGLGFTGPMGTYLNESDWRRGLRSQGRWFPAVPRSRECFVRGLGGC